MLYAIYGFFFFLLMYKLNYSKAFKEYFSLEIYVVMEIWEYNICDMDSIKSGD